MKHFRIRAESREEIERRVLLAFALNRADALTADDLVMATGISTRPVDQTPGLEAAITRLADRLVLAVGRDTNQRAIVTVLDRAALPHQAAASLRAEMGLEEPEEDEPRRLMAVPGPQLSDRLPIGGFTPIRRPVLRLVDDHGRYGSGV